MKTTDDNTYYYRNDYSVKIKTVKKYISELNEVNKIIDFGCNNGEVTKGLVSDGFSVLGIDYSKNLKIPDNYNFINANIVEYYSDISCDCAVFLSLYHHILGKYGLKIADDLFYKIFFNTKYLIFDSGNLSETKRNSTYWFKEQSKYFKNEKDLLNHFDLKYKIISEYSIAGGIRNIVVFTNDSDIYVNKIEEYQRMPGSVYSKIGLLPKDSNKQLWDGIYYTKLKIGSKYFFTKKHKENSYNEVELKNTILMNEKYDRKYLIQFYGYNEKYGLIFEWLDNFEYIKKIKIKTEYINLVDVDEININGNIKHIDFHR